MTDFKLKVFSVADEACATKPETDIVRKILEYHGYDHHQFVDPLWFGWPSKLIGFIDLVRMLDTSYTHVMLLDARDVVLLASPGKVMERWFKFNHPWIYNAEPHIWSPNSFQPEDYPTPQCTYRYLNAGACIGERRHIYDWYSIWTNGFTETPACFRGDQDWVAERFIRWYPDAIKLDHDCELFQCMCGSDWLVDVTPGRLYNRETDTYPLIIHFNGGTDITAPDRRSLWNHWPIT